MTTGSMRKPICFTNSSIVITYLHVKLSTKYRYVRYKISDSSVRYSMFRHLHRIAHLSDVICAIQGCTHVHFHPDLSLVQKSLPYLFTPKSRGMLSCSYLHGQGHPWPQRSHSQTCRDSRDRDRLRSNLRAHHFNTTMIVWGNSTY